MSEKGQLRARRGKGELGDGLVDVCERTKRKVREAESWCRRNKYSQVALLTSSIMSALGFEPAIKTEPAKRNNLASASHSSVLGTQ